MCGITGIYNRDGSPAAAREVQAMADLLAHRGPDGQGTCISKHAGIGHRRLAIIDPKCGAQPMYDRTKRYALIYNGELYNFRELREELKKKGAKFTTDSDTEVIIEGYVAEGTDFFAKMNGMFAFAILDKKTNTLVLCRDRLGIKPLYLYESPDTKTILFASEIKAFYGVKKFKPLMNYNAIKEYLTFSNLHNNISFFAHVRQLPPGSWMVLSGNTVKEESYWHSQYTKKHASHDAYVAEFTQLFHQAVQRHMISDVPLGSYLSGGIDSSGVATTAATIYKKQLHVFTGTFPEGGRYTELPCAQAVAKQIKAKHHITTITPKHFRESMEQIVYHLDEPRVGMGAFSQYHVAQEAAKHVTVILTGHGGDELFAGYPLYKARLLKSVLRTPGASLKALFTIKPSELPHTLYYLFYPLFQPEVGYGTFVMFSQNDQKKLFTTDFQHKTNQHDPYSYIRSLATERSLSPEDRVQEIYLRTYLPALFIVEDKIGMAHSLESRTPICDNTLVAFSESVPLAAKLHDGVLKAIPKDAFRNQLPALLYTQPKKGFPTPLSLWFRNELRPYVEELLLSERFSKRGICNQTAVKKLLEAHFSSRSDSLRDYVQAARIWSLINIELWFRIFIDGEKTVRGKA
jgi:asparagine synthase (glutamine-hydrolysing)